jgi:2-polyprenyl-6-methoxyphenol hydroxylase-like FAD-dependent oxidoreductase
LAGLQPAGGGDQQLGGGVCGEAGGLKGELSGAGIAGLTLAHWLARHGFQPTVVERAAALRAYGNGVDVRGHAGQVAERMGIMPRVRELAADVRGIKFVDAADRPVARVDLRDLDPSSVEIMRGDLVALLREVATRG